MPARPLTIALLAVALVAALPSAAGAATSIDLSGERLQVTGDAFANAIVVRRVGDGYTIGDVRARLAIEPGSPCFFTSNATPPHEAKCLRPSELNVLVEGRGGDDALTMSGGTRKAFLDGEAGADRLQGGPGPDTLRGGAGEDELLGAGGDDLINGEAGPDSLRGGLGTDTVSYSDRTQPVNITLPVDSLDVRADDGNLTDSPGPGSRDSIGDDVENAVGGDGNDTLVGSNGPNRLDGRDGQDTMFGRGGDDSLDGGLGPDRIEGGDGFDRAIYDDRSVPVSVTLDGQANDGNPNEDALIVGVPIGGAPGGGASENVGLGVEGVIGGEAADTLIGNDGPNRLAGGAGGDRIDGGGGADRIEGDDGDDTLDGGSGADDISGGAGVDGESYGSRSDPVTVSLDGLANDGNAQDLFADNLRADVENVKGTSGDDVLRGSAADNLLDGSFGDNRLEGLGGNDTLTASNRGSDVLDGGDGGDTASYRGTGFDGVTVTLDGRANDGAPAGAAGVPAGGEADNVLTEDVIGSEFDDVITGNDESNRLSGGDGTDTIHGAGAGDTILGGPGLDVLIGDTGVDVLNANDGLSDRVDCGPDPDVANLDLADAVGALRGGGILPATAGCEAQNIAPHGQLPNVRLASTTVRIDHRGRARIALRCPRRSKRRCTGTLRLQRPHGAHLGRARFSIPRAGRAILTLRLRRRVRPSAAQILTRERDVAGRPKRTLVTVRLRRQSRPHRSAPDRNADRELLAQRLPPRSRRSCSTAPGTAGLPVATSPRHAPTCSRAPGQNTRPKPGRRSSNGTLSALAAGRMRAFLPAPRGSRSGRRAGAQVETPPYRTNHHSASGSLDARLAHPVNRRSRRASPEIAPPAIFWPKEEIAIDAFHHAVDAAAAGGT